jgi:hypothetical protein
MGENGRHYVYLRWKRKPLKRRWAMRDPGDSLSAVLVECQRVQGAPRQRYVKHLAVIPERHTRTYGWALVFWERADQALDSLELDRAERARIEAALVETVPRPVRDEGPSRVELEATIAAGRR